MVLIPGAVYWAIVWRETGISPYRCIYGDAGCALTFATSVLATASSAAFLAAYGAARYAIQSYRISLDGLRLEQSRILVERAYRLNHTDTVPDRCVHVVLFRDKLAVEEPSVGQQDALESEVFEFESIGRAPIVDAEITLMLTLTITPHPMAATTLQQPVPIGSLRSTGSVYVRLWIERALLANVANVGWNPDEATMQVDDTKVRLLFRPLERRPFEKVKAVRSLPALREVRTRSALKTRALSPRAPKNPERS